MVVMKITYLMASSLSIQLLKVMGHDMTICEVTFTLERLVQRRRRQDKSGSHVQQQQFTKIDILIEIK
ncbi:unnamed protein product [Gongylonema pulchrum]|uniref:Secreted protein n=1 Tax=Gongylonema pulchrum TaxID=637853 RepID=A0A183D0L7_9BILA|nr:unnamed protein product [Gongylonema pulchrum]